MLRISFTKCNFVTNVHVTNEVKDNPWKNLHMQWSFHNPKFMTTYSEYQKHGKYLQASMKKADFNFFYYKSER